MHKSRHKNSIYKLTILSQFFKGIKQKLRNIALWKLEASIFKRWIIDANTNLNDIYRYGLIQRIYFNKEMSKIEDLLRQFDSFESLVRPPRFKEYKKINDFSIKLMKNTKHIINSVGMTKLSNYLETVARFSWNPMFKSNGMSSRKVTSQYIKQLEFLDKYVKVINATVKYNMVITEPRFIRMSVENRRPNKNLCSNYTHYDRYATCFLQIPFKENSTLEIRIHFLKDSLCTFKNEPYFKEKLKTIYETCLSLIINNERIDKPIVDSFIKHVLTPKQFCIENIGQIRKLLIKYLKQFIRYKDLMKDRKKMERFFLNQKLIEKAEIIIVLILMSEYKENFDHFALRLYTIYDENDSELSNHTPEQPKLWDFLPRIVQNKLIIAKVKITEERKFNIEDIENNTSYEDKILLLDIPNSVKEKAYVKLREVNSRQNEGAGKAITWLDGFLNIPFGIYRKEKFIDEFNKLKYLANIVLKDNEIPYYQSIQKSVHKYSIYLNHIIQKNTEYIIDVTKIKQILQSKNLKELRELWKDISKNQRLDKSSLKKKILISKILEQTNISTLSTIFKLPRPIKTLSDITMVQSFKNDWDKMKLTQSEYMKNIKKSLDDAVYSHDNAKEQIERIVGQWLTGKSSGYVLGFEGPPGVGKTTMAKYGLANILKDEEGNPRPFKFMPIGGACNGSTLVGSSYTYLGSQWGSIVNCLMESKCMNPIIFFDELDKVSNTEHGREIIGILTHLTDSTQNTEFRDKYFRGIDFDLSKALIIFSYNNPQAIDPILLDRIHRIKFKEMTLNDKFVVINKYLIPSICKEIGLDQDSIIWEKDLLEFIINTYTLEPGVRKIKQILYDIYRDINIKILRDDIEEYPHMIKKSYVCDTILKKYPIIHPLQIKGEDYVGIINGMYASGSSFGGILQIESKFVCDTTPFKLILTGSLKNVMLESMQIAKNVALELLSTKLRESITKKVLNKDNIMKGIHIHCPEGGVVKDGPSAGQAITICLYSMFTGKKIPDNFAFTGEIRLSGEILRVGGISSKVTGALRAGVKNIIMPEENRRDYEMLLEEVSNLPEHEIHFVSNIHQTMKILWG